MLYKDPKDVKYKVYVIDKDKNSVYVDDDNDMLVFDFWADCGKHGTDEPIAEFTLTPKQLLEILQHTT